MSGTVGYLIQFTKNISDSGGASYQGCTYQEIVVNNGTTLQQLSFCGVTTADLFYLKSDKNLTLHLNANTGNGIPLLADKPFSSCGTAVTSAYITNQSGSACNIVLKLWGDSAAAFTPVVTDLSTALANTSNSALGDAMVGYKASGTGSVARTVHSRLADMCISPEDYGAVGDGLTNDTVAMQAAIDYWGLLNGGCLRLTPGKNYLINSALSYTFSSNSWLAKVIDGRGSSMTSGLTSGYLLTLTAAADVRNIDIIGAHITGSGTEEGILKLDGGDGSASQAMYHVNLIDLRFLNFAGNGIHLSNNFFEATLRGCTCIAADANITGYPIYCEEDTYLTLSSIDIIGCNTRNGYYGVHVKSPVADVKITGGTFLLAERYGVFLGNSAGSVVSGAHFEANWKGVVALGAAQAGLHIEGSGTVISCYGYSNGSTHFQTYIVDAYPASGKTITLIGGDGTGSIAKYAYIASATGGKVIIEGNMQYEVADSVPVVSRVGKLYQRTDYAITSGTGEDTLMSYTLPAGTLGKSGGLKITAAGRKTGSTGNKTVNAYFGTWTVAFNVAANDTNDWRFQLELVNVTDEAVQRGTWIGYNGYTTVLQNVLYGTEDTSANVVVKFTGECADAGDTVIQELMIVEAL